MGPQQMLEEYRVQPAPLLSQRWTIAFGKQQKGAAVKVKVNVQFHSEV